MGERGRSRIRLDPHVHTDASHDCNTALTEVLAAAREADLDAIAITDHDEMGESLRAVEMAPEYGLTAVPGVEVSTSVGHLLALFVTDRPAAGDSLAATVRAVRERGGITVVPHPFQMSRHGIRKRRLLATDADVDAIEVFNAWTMTGVQNRRARRFAARDSYARIGASDAHTAAMVGRAYTVLELPAAAVEGESGVDREHLRSALTSGTTRPDGEGATVAQYVGKYARSLGARTATLRPKRVFSTDHP